MSLFQRPLKYPRGMRAGEALREPINAPLMAYKEDAYESSVAEVCQVLPAEQLDALWRAGRLLTVNAAMELALSR